MAKWVYMFTEGNAGMRNLLGGKGVWACRCLRVLRLRQKHVRSTMRMEERSMMRSWDRSWKPSQRWKR